MITREDLVEQSVQDYVRVGLEHLNYSPEIVNIREAFPSAEERAAEMTKSQLAIGFNFDDGGRLMELGSDLTERQYTIEFWTFGLTRTQGRNIAHVVRGILEAQGTIPLVDVGDNARPVIDRLLLPERRAVTVTRQVASNPRPWDMFVWTTKLIVNDQYSPSAFAGP